MISEYCEKYEYISSSSDMLEKVLALSDKNKKTLGLIPRAAFIESAKQRCILVLSVGGEVLGYCLFRKAKRARLIKITQLCVSKNHRGLGYSEKLINVLKRDFQEEYFGIGLNCRNDYLHAKKLWERCGFVPVKEQRSRSREGKYLTYWKFAFPQKDLFAGILEDTINAVVDLNVVIKLRDRDLSEEDEVGFLLSDFISPEVSYFYSGESLHEIMRDKDPERRDKTRRQIYNFFPIQIEGGIANRVFDDLSKHFDMTNVNDVSDCKQLSETIAAGIQYFITTDQGVVCKRDEISDEYCIDILTPLEFFVNLDQLLNESKYVPQRFGGTTFEKRSIKYSELEMIIGEFLQKHNHEKRVALKAAVKSLCIDEDSILNVVIDRQQPVGLLGIRKSKDSLFVDFLRSINGVYKELLIRQLLNESIGIARQSKAKVIEVHERYIDESVVSILKEFRFIKDKSLWKKHLDYRLLNSVQFYDEYECQVRNMGLARSSSSGILYEIERYFHPMKLTDLSLPCFIIPIKPYWASQLFDFISAGESLFGASPHLVWERKNVYYRSVKPHIEICPARILWYSSNSPKFRRSRGIVGSSYLDQVIVDEPKVLWRRLKKYGVYKWKDVFDLSGQDVSKEIKALLFSDTEVFPNILGLERIREVLGKEHTFQGPIRIESSQFFELYKSVY